MSGDHLCSPDNKGEIWKDIAGFERLYMASNRGRIWSVPRRDPAGRTRGGRFLTLSLNKGYYTATLSRNGYSRGFPAHQLVMLAFVGEPSEGQEVCHGRAGSLVNWWPENLSYGTHSQNNGEDKLRDGTLRVGEMHPSAKLTDEQRLEVVELFRAGETKTALGAKFGVSGNAIAKILRKAGFPSRPYSRAPHSSSSTLRAVSKLDGMKCE